MTDPETDAPAADDGPVVVLLDVLPNGRPDDDRPQYRKSPVAYGLGTDAFRLYELTLDEEADVSVSHRRARRTGRRSVPRGVVRRPHPERGRRIEYAVEDIVEGDEKRFVDFYNEAGPITPGSTSSTSCRGSANSSGTRYSTSESAAFESFEEVSERVTGLHHPREVLVERIVEEIHEEDLKYRRFVGYEE